MKRLALALLLGCTAKTPAAPVGEGIFAEGCPRAGKATARMIGVDGRLSGPDAVGGKGDVLLMSERAAFIVSGPRRNITYYHYAGIPTDAVTLEGCAQKGPDKLEEVGLMLGKLDVGTFSNSVLRAFRGDRVEILNDGADGGPAKVRVIGRDDYYWLVEYTLVVEGMKNGGRPLSPEYGVEVWVDYTIDPGSQVLQVDLQIVNESDTRKALLGGALITLGDSLELHKLPGGEVRFGGFRLEHRIPWLSASDGDGAYAFAIAGGDMAHTHIAGVDVFLDFEQTLSAPLAVDKTGDRAGMKLLIAVGDGDSASASRHLAAYNKEPLDGRPYTSVDVKGRVLDADGRGVEGVFVDLETAGEGSEWGVLDAFRTGAGGTFLGAAPDFAVGPYPGWRYRLRPRIAGRDRPEPTPLVLGRELTLTLPAPGELEYAFTDESGGPSPARLGLVRADRYSERHFLEGSGKLAVPPGRYRYSVTRGMEHAPVYGEIDLAPRAKLTARLERVVDTRGFLSVDTHVHSAPSTDSQVDERMRIYNAAAHGLEIIVATEHEVVASLQPFVEETGLGYAVNTITGQEVTATIPEHLIMFPVEPDGTPRGGFIPWYRKDLDQLFGEMRARGSRVNILNHPSYLGIIEWDRMRGAPALRDPTRIGLAPDAKLWSWNFDAVEVMNGFGSPFADGNKRFDNWQSFQNHGHRITAVGCSDTHGLEDIGFPRTYVASSTDEPKDMKLDDVVRGFTEGRALVSGGAFLRVRANDTAGMGDTLTDTDGTLRLAIRAEALREIDVAYLLVLANCQQVARIDATDPDALLKYDGAIDVPLTEDAQLVVLAFGAKPMPEGLPGYDPRRTPRAFTNPIFVDRDGNGRFEPPGGRECRYD